MDQFFKGIKLYTVYQFMKTRYLGRSRYVLELSYLINQIPFVVGLEKNTDSLILILIKMLDGMIFTQV